MEDKNKNLKSGIITELYPNTNKGNNNRDIRI